MKILSKKSIVFMGSFFLITGSGPNVANSLFNTPASKNVLNPSVGYPAMGYSSYPVMGYPQIGSTQMQSGGAGGQILSAFGNIAGNLMTSSSDKTKNKESSQMSDYQKLSDKQKKQKEVQKTQEQRIIAQEQRSDVLADISLNIAILQAYHILNCPEITINNLDNATVNGITEIVKFYSQDFLPNAVSERIRHMATLGVFDRIREIRKNHGADQTELDKGRTANKNTIDKKQVAQEIERLLTIKKDKYNRYGKPDISAIAKKVGVSEDIVEWYIASRRN